MKAWQARQIALIGQENTEKLTAMRVLIAGVGGVGGYVVEALARAGVGTLILIDHDVVSVSNINRQIIALTDTVGQIKTDLFVQRIERINPACTALSLPVFLTPENTAQIVSEYAPDFIIDAIDFVPAKLALAKTAMDQGIPLISSMGTGNKLDPERLKIGDLAKTSVCPLARVMRRETKTAGIAHMTVLWSDELPSRADESEKAPASISFVPASAGLLIASHLVRCVIREELSSCRVLPMKSCGN